jgi:CRISPR-associated exonuclease Cas4
MDGNLFTAEGRIMHERIDLGARESRKGVRLAFSVALRSLRLGLSGKADVVEFHREAGAADSDKTSPTIWRPFPVEHKRGRPKKADWDKVQLCAQALCLEEMLVVAVPRGALFMAKPAGARMSCSMPNCGATPRKPPGGFTS